MTAANCRTDSDLVRELMKIGIPEEDAYELIDGYDSPQPPAIRGAKVRRLEDYLEVKLTTHIVKIFDECEDGKWLVSPTPIR